MSTSSDDLSKILWNDTPPKNGYASDDQYHEHVLEQYKLYVEMADRISNRRDVANAFFLTLNGLFLGAAGALIDKGYEFSPKWALLFPLAVLLLECFFWWRLIISYKQLNGAKFNIIGEFEMRLPASPYRKAEWFHALKEGKDRNVYWPLTHLESKIPVMFAIGYLIAASALWCSA
jgi:hypothetical protein